MTCGHRYKSGMGCLRRPIKGGKFCWSHDPATASIRKKMNARSSATRRQTIKKKREMRKAAEEERLLHNKACATYALLVDEIASFHAALQAAVGSEAAAVITGGVFSHALPQLTRENK